MSEFHNDEQREQHLAGLEHEKEGYEVRVKQAQAADDKAAEKRYSDRIAEVKAEIARVTGDVDETPAEPKKRSRGGKKAEAEPKGDEPKEGDGDEA